MKFKELAVFLVVCLVTNLPMANHISFGLNKQAQTTANLNLRKGLSTTSGSNNNCSWNRWI